MKTIEELQKENAELSATISVAHSDLADFRNDAWNLIKPTPDSEESQLIETVGLIMEKLESPSQSLSDIKAEAVMGAIDECHQNAQEDDGELLVYISDLVDHANKLRGGE